MASQEPFDELALRLSDASQAINRLADKRCVIHAVTYTAWH